MAMGGDIQNLQGRGLIIDSVPVNVAHHCHGFAQGSIVRSGAGGGDANTSSGKRLRLFGVNMECASSAEDSKAFSSGSAAAHVTTVVSNSLLPPPPPPSSSLQRLRMPLPPHEDPLSLSAARFGDHHKRGTSVLFDLEPSFQFRK